MSTVAYHNVTDLQEVADENAPLRLILKELQAVKTELVELRDAVKGRYISPEMKAVDAAKELVMSSRRFWTEIVHKRQLLEPIPGKPQFFRRKDVMRLKQLLASDRAK